MATAPSLDLVAYAAGSVVVLYNHKKNKQVAFLHASSTASPSPPSNQANSASWSNAFPNRHTIAGDGVLNPLGSLGLIDPSVASSNNASSSSKKTPVSNKAKPISCVAFSPDGNFLAVGEVLYRVKNNMRQTNISPHDLHCYTNLSYIIHFYYLDRPSTAYLNMGSSIKNTYK